MFIARVLFAIVILVTITSCKKDSITNVMDNLKPGRRDYTWKLDTLKTDGYFYINSIWGADPNNLWGVGSAGTLRECMWHYDGIKWKTNEPIILSNFSCVFGFSENNIWAAGENGKFYKYDVQWQLFQTINLDGFDHIDINYIWGTDPNNLFFCGSASNTKIEGKYIGILGKFNGIRWEFIAIPQIRAIFGSFKVQKMTGNIFIEALDFYKGNFTEMLFVYNTSNQLKLIASGKGYYQLGYLDGEVYFNINQKVYKYFNNSLILWRDFTNTQYLGVIYGRTEKDFLGIGKNGEVLHYNGENWATLYKNESFDYWGWYLIDNDFFSFVVDLRTNERFMLRGTLN